MINYAKFNKIKILSVLGCALPMSCGQDNDNDKFRKYIASHPEEIVSSVLKYREDSRKKYEKTRSALLEKVVADLAPGSGVVINPAGRIHVVEILDYNCGYCKAAFADLEKRAAGEWKDVRFTLVPLPIISQDSRLATMATNFAVAENQQPLALMEAFLRKSVVNDAIAREVATAYSIKIGEAERFSDSVINNMKIMERLGIKATPTFIVGGTVLTGYKPNDLSAAIIAARDHNRPGAE